MTARSRALITRCSVSPHPRTTHPIKHLGLCDTFTSPQIYPPADGSIKQIAFYFMKLDVFYVCVSFPEVYLKAESGRDSSGCGRSSWCITQVVGGTSGLSSYRLLPL